ncbi:MAG: hypothetical protein IPN86_00120 [Saprospiraceae bacterium]|nr:hypothetical protein [Saprospiraceae bacterium]
MYNTYIKSEWDAMDKGNVLSFCINRQRFLPGDEDKEAEIIKIVNDNTKQIDDTEDIVIVDDPKEPNVDEPSDDDEIVVVEPTDDELSDDDEIVVVEPDDDDEIVEVDDNLDGGNGIGIDPDIDSPDFYNDDISIIVKLRDRYRNQSIRSNSDFFDIGQFYSLKLSYLLSKNFYKNEFIKNRN